jgi:hypothetical protein
MKKLMMAGTMAEIHTRYSLNVSLIANMLHQPSSLTFLNARRTSMIT